jgi:hypothetical protein
MRHSRPLSALLAAVTDAGYAVLQVSDISVQTSARRHARNWRIQPPTANARSRSRRRISRASPRLALRRHLFRQVISRPFVSNAPSRPAAPPVILATPP